MLIALFILFLVGMDGQVAVLKADQALLLCLKAVASCSSYQGRWMADSDVIAAIRHEYSFWDSDFAKVLTYTKLNKVVKKDPVTKQLRPDLHLTLYFFACCGRFCLGSQTADRPLVLTKSSCTLI